MVSIFVILKMAGAQRALEDMAIGVYSGRAVIPSNGNRLRGVASNLQKLAMFKNRSYYSPEADTPKRYSLIRHEVDRRRRGRRECGRHRRDGC